MCVLKNNTKTVPALNSVNSFVIIVSPMNVATFGSLFLNMQVVLSMVEFSISTGFAETLLLIYSRFQNKCRLLTAVQRSTDPISIFASNAPRDFLVYNVPNTVERHFSPVGKTKSKRFEKLRKTKLTIFSVIFKLYLPLFRIF